MMKETLAEFVARETALTAEFGPPLRPLSMWFMYDNHTFSQLKGTADEMGAQIRRRMDEDKYCGSVFVRRWADGPEIDELCFHGDYKNPANTRIRIAEWVEAVRPLLSPLARAA